MMKLLFAGLFILMSLHSWSQIDFKAVDYKLPGARTYLVTTAIADINNDGLNDLIIGTGYYLDETYDYSIIIYKQTKEGKLDSPIMFKYPDSYPGLKVLQVEDLNNDHLNDIIIGYGNFIEIFYQSNSGTFDKTKSYYSGQSVYGLKTGDLNNDGLTDFAVSHSPDAFIKVFIQNTDGSFTIKSVAVQQAFYDELDIADVNGDNLNDIVLVSDITTELSLLILYQKARIGITNQGFHYTFPGYYYPNFNGIGIGDLDNDGRNDIVGSYVNNSNLIVLMYQDSLNQIGQKSIPLNAFPVCNAVEISDLNCDGNNEIIVGNDASVSIYEKNSFQQYKDYIRFDSYANYSPYGLAVGDLNNDNKKDIVTVGDNGNFTILYNTSLPTKFIKIDSYLENESKTLDTATTKSIVTTSIIDPSATCKVNRILKETITKTTKREYYSGDSISVRYFSLCSPAASDTIRKHFNVTINYAPSIVSIKDTINMDELSASLSKMTINREENSINSFSIYSNICWKLSTDQDWLNLSASDGSGNTPITVTAKENTSLDSRTAIITLKGDGMQDIPITVTQTGMKPYLNVSTTSIVLDTFANDTVNFDIESNINWSISSNASWLTIDKKTGNGNNQIVLAGQENLSEKTRYGTLTITGADTIQRIINITQPSSVTPEKGSLIQLDIFPNPSWGYLNIIFSDPSIEGTIAVYNVPGVKLLTQSFNKGTSKLNIEHLRAGIYTLSIQTNKGNITRKIIKK